MRQNWDQRLEAQPPKGGGKKKKAHNSLLERTSKHVQLISATPAFVDDQVEIPVLSSGDAIPCPSIPCPRQRCVCPCNIRRRCIPHRLPPSSPSRSPITKYPFPSTSTFFKCFTSLHYLD